MSVLKKILGPTNSISIAAGLVAIFSLLSRLFGVLRDRILAGQFGAGDALDAYYAAFQIPDLIFNLVVLGALSAGFIPLFTKLLEKQNSEVCEVINAGSHKTAWEFAANIFNIILIVLLLLSLVGMFFSPFLVKIVAPGFSLEKQNSVAQMMQIMFLSPIFLGASGIFGGILQSFRRFVIFSLAPLMYNLGIIIGALFFSPVVGLIGLAYGVALGAFLHMLFQAPTVFRLGFRPRFFVSFKDVATKKLFLMMIPRVFSLGVSQLNLFFITIIASTLAGGSLAIFNLANNLQYFPIGIFGISFAIAAFPSLSAAEEDNVKTVDIFSRVLRKILFFIVPATVLLLILRAQIIRIILGSGAFDWEDTIMAMNTLGFFALSLFAQAAIPLLTRLYFARKDSRTPLITAIISVAINIVLAFYFSKKLDAAGLALAFSIGSIVNFSLLWLAWRFKNGSLDESRIVVSAIKFSSASLACGMAAQGTKVLVAGFVDMDKFWGVFTQAGIAAFVGIIFYIAFLWMFRSEELLELTKVLKNKIKN